MSFITLENITFGYDESNVLEGFSLSMEKGECVAVLGDNGSGKTTLFRILNALSFPTSGKYTFDGTETNEKYIKVNKNSKLFHKRIGYLFQSPDVMLFCGDVYSEIAFGPRQMGLDDKEVDRRVTDLMELFGISELSDKAPYHLSGGQKKKVALASVMSLNPDVIVLDEPFAGLDKKSIAMLEQFLSQLKEQGKTLIIATHNEGFVESLADKVINLSE